MRVMNHGIKLLMPALQGSQNLSQVLPLGDSITEAQFGGYRKQLFSLSVGAGKVINFLGSGSNGPDTISGQTFPKSHEGHNGFSISQIGDLSDPWVTYAPEIVLLHIGTNDMLFNPTGASTRFATLLDELIVDAPNALIAVAKIIPIPAQASRVATYNSELTTVVNDRINAGKHLLLVDQFTGFPESELEGDGVHPTDPNGYAIMGGAWYTSISGYLENA